MVALHKANPLVASWTPRPSKQAYVEGFLRECESGHSLSDGAKDRRR